jgi:hypothetical protein
MSAFSLLIVMDTGRAALSGDVQNVTPELVLVWPEPLPLFMDRAENIAMGVVKSAHTTGFSSLCETHE